MKKVIKVIQFYRKPRPAENFSIENYFRTLREHFCADMNISVIESTYYSKGLFPRLYNMLEAAFRQGDVNHVTGDVHFLSIFLKRRRTILTIHDCGFMRHPSGIARMILKWFWLKLPVRRSSVVTTVSENTRQEVIGYTRCSPEKVIVIPVCVQPHFQYSPKIFNEDYPRILHIGTAANKNLERLIPALQGIHCVLDIVGKLSTEQRKLLEENEVNYQNAYHISDEEMLEKYRQCDLLAFVSTFEGFGMPIVEANAVGRPVISSHVASIPEVAGEAAYLVDPHNVQDIRKGIQRIIQDHTFRSDLIRKGRQNYQRFQANQIAAAYEKLYLKVANDINKT